MFRNWNVCIKPLLKKGENTLEVRFLPARPDRGGKESRPRIRPPRRRPGLHTQGGVSLRLGLGTEIRHLRHMEAGPDHRLVRHPYPQIYPQDHRALRGESHGRYRCIPCAIPGKLSRSSPHRSYQRHAIKSPRIGSSSSHKDHISRFRIPASTIRSSGGRPGSGADLCRDTRSRFGSTAS